MSKTVLITGASRGIGCAAARLFAQNGYNIAINYLSSEHKAHALTKELQNSGYNAIAIKANVANRLETKHMISEIDKSFGKIDVLVNNAGIAQQKLFTDIGEDEWDEMFNVNVKGMFNCCQAVLPQMIRNKAGKIINLSSIWGITGASCEVHYSASKAAIIGLTKALAKEVAPSNINVNCVAPGVIHTDMNLNLSEETIDSLKEDTPMGVLGTAQDIAEAILFLASDKSKFITGQIISPNGGFII